MILWVCAAKIWWIQEFPVLQVWVWIKKYGDILNILSQQGLRKANSKIIRPFNLLTTDDSPVRLGVILEEQEDSTSRSLSHISKKLSIATKRYSQLWARGLSNQMGMPDIPTIILYLYGAPNP